MSVFLLRLASHGCAGSVYPKLCLVFFVVAVAGASKRWITVTWLCLCWFFFVGWNLCSCTVGPKRLSPLSALHFTVSSCRYVSTGKMKGGLLAVVRSGKAVLAFGQIAHHKHVFRAFCVYD